MSQIDKQIEREKKLERKARLAKRQLAADLQDTFGNAAGRRVLYEVLSLCGIYSDSFTGNSTTFYKEGKRAVGLQILEMVGIEVYLKTLRENMEGSNG
jgi:hypothetical protein